MPSSILLLNGPNLNMLGLRQPEIYGRDTLADVEAMCIEAGKQLGLTVEARQSNYEGELVTWIQQARDVFDGIVINPGAYSHTSIAILDALNAFEGKVVEVHISDIHAREEFRHHSYVSHRADHVIVGQGIKGYTMALDELANRLLA
ncbi:type II 3-dehydroquinate dehydratase [Pseudahrensia aquimaris]|uniref:3-dehydroquinate dehydratase n=1 Tax=Pseudahrensia aquimaris TaxID=744461 RepID=A0ABW3F8V6_9HYPH